MWLRCCKRGRGRRVKDTALDGESGSRSKEEAADGVGVDSECLAVNPTT